MKSIAEINAIKEKMRSQLGARQGTDSKDKRVVVGMATCGIAAGARETINALVDEAAKRGLNDVRITQAGCLGMCKLEPMVQVYIPGEEVVTYVYVDADVARRIISDHVVNGNIVRENVIGKEE
ncbi:MAG: (2Fe-2S) ferredoxin domain-containing protein [Christensenellales bacterium]|jgi:NADP-reducing hydrogenase subunit HndB